MLNITGISNIQYRLSNIGQQARKLAAKSWWPSLFVAAILLVLLTIGWYWSPRQLVFPFNHIQSWKYWWLASRLPEGDVRAKRFRAIAEAVRQGRTDYQFETGPLPTQK